MKIKIVTVKSRRKLLWSKIAVFLFVSATSAAHSSRANAQTADESTSAIQQLLTQGGSVVDEFGTVWDLNSLDSSVLDESGNDPLTHAELMVKMGSGYKPGCSRSSCRIRAEIDSLRCTKWCARKWPQLWQTGFLANCNKGCFDQEVLDKTICILCPNP